MNQEIDNYMQLIRVRSLLNAERILTVGLTDDDRDILKVIVDLTRRFKASREPAVRHITDLINEALKG